MTLLLYVSLTSTRVLIEGLKNVVHVGPPIESPDDKALPNALIPPGNYIFVSELYHAV